MKRLIATIISSFILASFLISGVGFSIYTHTCKKDGVSYSLFSSSNHSCASDKKILNCEKKSACCLPEAKDLEADFKFESKECCKDDFFFLAFDSDINTLNQEKETDLQLCDLLTVIYQDLIFVEKKLPKKDNKAPPFFNRKTYLAQIQTYII